MRGKASGSFGDYARFRITPAYAGKSFSCHISQCNAWDHPRLCGEKDRLKALSNDESGSPPPMRGKGVPAALKVQHIGITPAYAGKS